MQRLYYRFLDRPVNNDDPMYMIWYNNECVQTGKRKNEPVFHTTSEMQSAGFHTNTFYH